MKNHEYAWGRAMLLIALVLGGPAFAAQAPSEQSAPGDAQSPQVFGEWKVSQSEGMTKLNTHGTRVWGHQFGFIEMPAHCNDHIVWIEWSSMKTSPADLKKVHNVRLEIQAAGETVPIDIELMEALPLTPDLTVIALTNFDADDRFLDLIQRAQELKVRVTGPRALLQVLDVTDDTFQVNGFADARARAAAMCARSGKPPKH